MTTAYAGTYTVTATATRNLYGTICTATDTKSVQVTVNAPVAGTLNVVGNTTICAGNSTTLTASVTGNTGMSRCALSRAKRNSSLPKRWSVALCLRTSSLP